MTPLRRPITSLLSHAAKRDSTTSLSRFPSSLTRAYVVIPSLRSSPGSTALRLNTRPTQNLSLRQYPQQQFIRCFSDEGAQQQPPTFKQWMFEDITSRLPTTTTSPPSKPQKHLILIDVREPAELNSTGIIPTAVAVPLASQPDALFLTPDEFETRFGYPKPGVEEMEAARASGEGGPDVVFYCKAGVRAKAAAQLAVQAGYDQAKVGVYEGSWLDWEKRGGPVEKWDGGES